MNEKPLSRKEFAYATALRETMPPQAGYQYNRWRELRDMIREDYVRPSRWDRFTEITERGS